MWTYQHNNFFVHQVPVLSDNYIYIIQDSSSDTVLVVDPALAAPVQQACDNLGIKPTHILNTHHHWDHTDGNTELVKQYQCQIIGNQADSARIPHISNPVQPGNLLEIGTLNIQVLDTPGHTLGHIVFIVDDALFCGDTLFGAGCGRLFEGSPEQMWKSLQQLAMLDEQTQVYCAHEYTLTNLSFASTIDLTNKVLQERVSSDTKKQRLQQPTIPSSIGLEKVTNPFLRPLDPDFCKFYNLNTQQNFDALHIFKDLRERRNQW